jgi:NAD(P)-dependent dehydrogenase (short-subunit alcohol dehydrogenase family)
LDVGSEQSVDTAVATIIAEHGRIDVLVHNVGHMMSMHVTLKKVE